MIVMALFAAIYIPFCVLMAFAIASKCLKGGEG